MESTILRRATIAASALTLTLAGATASFAGDCSYKKSAAAQTTVQMAQVQTDVMDATIHKVGGNYGSDKTYKKADTGTIIDAAVGTPDLSTLTAAVKAAGLVDTLNSDGPFTVFAPTNAAFDALPEGTVDTLLKPENKATLTNILTSHVVAGNFSSSDILGLVNAAGGKTTVTTVSGATLTVGVWNDSLYIKDENGGKSKVAIADIEKSNGTVHVITGVLLPKSDGTS